jgi:hypothetical protein
MLKHIFRVLPMLAIFVAKHLKQEKVLKLTNMHIIKGEKSKMTTHGAIPLMSRLSSL